MNKKWMKRFWVGCLMVGLLYVLARQLYVVPIVMYHNVDFQEEHPANLVSPEQFQKHMAFLAAHNFHVISLEDYISAKKSSRYLPFKTVVITFDDGYKNNYVHAYPVLVQFGFPATIFMVTDKIGTNGFLSADDLIEMDKHKISFGSHTHRHAYLPDHPAERIKEELTVSKTVLENILGHPVPTMSYPAGGFNEEVTRIARETGYQGACTTNRGFDKLNKDLYQLNRIRLSNKDNNDFYLWIKFSGFYNILRKGKNPS